MSETLLALSQQVGESLQKKGWIVSIAESCTGGGLGYWISSIDGSSAWFERGFITYSDGAKIELLGVQPGTLETYGAVSEETVREMAQGALKNSYADVSIAITGIAGPTGGAPGKPVGTVWVALASRHAKTIALNNHFTGDRQSIREQSIMKALNMLLNA